MSSIADNLRSVRQRIDEAAQRSGRSGSDVTLVAVTKTRSPEEILEAVSHGATDIGENYVQEAERKLGRITGDVRWHMIGHLQRNKAKAAVEMFSVVHSVDSEALARDLGRRAEAAGRELDVLIEVHISGEQSKHGVEEGEVLPLAADPEETRPYFRKLKQTWDRLPKEQRLYLSMGMTQDFEVAIEEGSNMVRIGTAIFGERI